jgi:hypothetical protein
LRNHLDQVKDIKKVLTEASGKDHVTVNARMIANGISYRIELEEGVLKAVGAAAMAGKGGGQRQGMPHGGAGK